MNAISLQEQFVQGEVPEGLTGFYKGKLLLLLPQSPAQYVAKALSSFVLPWRGKYFDVKKKEGDNILPMYARSLLRLYPEKIKIGKEAFGGFHAFPFKTAKKKGLKDSIDILQLDYDLPQNPKRVRDIVDELVMIKKDTYLGKAHVRKDGSFQTIAFFLLEA